MKSMGLGAIQLSDDAGLAALEPRQSWNTAECRLMLAILQDALATFESGLRPVGPTDHQEFRDVVEWIRNRDSDWPFSFESICECLQMNSEAVRTELIQLRRKAAAHPHRLGSLRILRSRT